MIMRLTQMDTILIRMLYLAAVGIVILTVLGAESIASAIFMLTFFLVVLLWCSGAVRKVTWTDVILILTVGLALGNVITNAWIENTKVSFSYFKKFIMFICTLIYFQAAHKLRIDDKTEKFLLTVNSALATFFAVYYCHNQTEVYLMNNRVSDYLTFGFTNPNLTALFLMCIYLGELHQFFRNRSAFKKLWHLFLTAVVCYFVWETGSRNCMLTLVGVTVLGVLLQLAKKGFRLPKWLSLLIAVWPIVFVLAYMLVIENQTLQKILSFMASEGKGIDARLTIWLSALQHYAESPLLGAYSQISRGTGMSQLHNTHLDILTSYGTIILILVCYLLYSVIHSANSRNMKEETMARICFSGTIIMGMGEAALFSGGLGIYIFSGMFLLLCNKERKVSAEDKLVSEKRE